MGSTQPSQGGRLHAFQVISDLHLEVGRQYSSFEFPVKAPNLIFAGDVGCLAQYDEYLDFIRKQTCRFERVFLVLGNHEFYDMTYAAGLEKARELEKEPSLDGRLILLDRTRYDIPDSHVTLLGCTLWSRVADDVKEIVRSKVKDYRRIEDWSVEVHNSGHEKDSGWLKDQVKEIQRGGEQRQMLIVTHHAPCFDGTSSPRHAQNPWTCAFASDTLPDEGWAGVKYWIFGHTHYTTEFTRGVVRVVSNQRGYVLPSESTEKKAENKFDVEKVIWM
ncbi:hypothetical protein DIZ76_012399 [Coccidioides immitis]|nr:hypothetical protein DIZ76_012399 [Coccidioides immitis]